MLDLLLLLLQETALLKGEVVDAHSGKPLRPRKQEVETARNAGILSEAAHDAYREASKIHRLTLETAR